MYWRQIIAGLLISLSPHFVQNLVFLRVVDFIYRTSLANTLTRNPNIANYIWISLVFLVSGVVGLILINYKNRLLSFLASGLIGLVAYFIPLYLSYLLLVPAEYKLPKAAAADKIISITSNYTSWGPTVLAIILMILIFGQTKTKD